MNVKHVTVQCATAGKFGTALVANPVGKVVTQEVLVELRTKSDLVKL